VTQSLQAFASQRYNLHAWCVMPNHVHVLIRLCEGVRLGDVIKSWKTFTGRRINQAIGGSGPFWALDYFDRFMRDETDFGNTIAYIENNPVTAGLVSSPEDWPSSSAAKS
jgi:REP element-mobilizing transposase RayT